MDTSSQSTSPSYGFFSKVLTNLTFWVFIAIVAGVLLGHFFPEQGMQMEFIGKTFVSIIKLFIAPIIFLTIVLGISGIVKEDEIQVHGH